MPRSPLPIDPVTLAREFKDFTYIVSHDLGAPLRAMVEFSRLLKSEYAHVLDEEGQLYLSFIVDGGVKMQQMLEGLLEYSRLNTQAKPPVTVDTREVVEHCTQMLKESIDATQAKLHIGALPKVEVDKDQFLQLMQGLLYNALKFQPSESIPSISVDAEKKGEDWVFTVADNGIGIEQEFHERVFRPFQRLHTDEEYPGVGMGLALARKIVERHQGRIWIESLRGEGAAFKFTLPIAGIAHE